ncbi:MAG: haloacid dehalogenase type II [Alteromonadaceae bacterium]|nr:haloacid dehalogenase type II [Alteromonadaceae bacterium]
MFHLKHPPRTGAARRSNPGATSTSAISERPDVIIFDVNETLLDLTHMRESVSTALNSKQELLPLWFTTMLHYSLVGTVSGRFEEFGAIGVAALQMVAHNNGISLTKEDAQSAIIPALFHLPAHPDVKPALQALKQQGYKLACLTNSSTQGVKRQFEYAGLTDCFDHRLSIEPLQIYKPDRRAYAWALGQLNVKPAQALMVAAHGWDIAGAQAAGMQTAFVARPGQSLYPLADTPNYNVTDLVELAHVLDID